MSEQKPINERTALKLWAHPESCDEPYLRVSTHLDSDGLVYNIVMKSGKKQIVFAACNCAGQRVRLEPIEAMEAACRWLRERIAMYEALSPEEQAAMVPKKSDCGEHGMGGMFAEMMARHMGGDK